MIIKKHKDNNFTIIDNEVLRDPNLSMKAKGLLCYLYHLPTDWNIKGDQIANVGPDGRKAIFSGLSELEKHGYLKRSKFQDPQGKWQHVSILTETPFDFDLPTS